MRRTGAVGSTSPTVDAAAARTIAPTPTPRNQPRSPPRKLSNTAPIASLVTSPSKWLNSTERPITSAMKPTAHAIATAAETATTPRRRSGATTTDPASRAMPRKGRNRPRNRTFSAVLTVVIAKSLFVSLINPGSRSLGIFFAVCGEIDFTPSITIAPASAMLRISSSRSRLNNWRCTRAAASRNASRKGSLRSTPRAPAVSSGLALISSSGPALITLSTIGFATALSTRSSRSDSLAC